MTERRQSHRGKASHTKAVARQESALPEQKDSDQQFKAPGETKFAGDWAQIQTSEGGIPASAAEEKTYRGPEPQASKEVIWMSPTPEQRHQAGNNASGSNVLAAAALIGIGVLIQPELLVGMAIGGGLVLGSGLIWNLIGQVAGGVVRPVVKTAVKAGYMVASQVQETVAEATEQVHDMVAEARAEQRGGATIH